MRPARMNPARRALLVRAAEATGLAALTAIAGCSKPAAAKAAKNDFKYQDHPHDGKSCGLCKFFSPDGPRAGTGSCSIIEGAIGRAGWCAAFVAERVT